MAFPQKKDVGMKSDSSDLLSLFVLRYIPGPSFVQRCGFLESCVRWMYVIHNYFSVAPLEVIPLDNMALGWQKNVAY